MFGGLTWGFGPSNLAMASLPKPLSLSILFLLLSSLSNSIREEEEEEPSPTVWPHQFHAILFMNYSGILEKIDLWYDWPNGRNFNVIQEQLGKLSYDLEWNNGTSFVYTLDSNKECWSAQLEVGILRPNWLDGAKYLGQRHVNGFLCNVWEKVDFIWYYEDVLTKRPVHWVFYTGREAHVMTFEVGAVLEDAKWQAPIYCFNESTTAASATTTGADDDLTLITASTPTRSSLQHGLLKGSMALLL